MGNKRKRKAWKRQPLTAYERSWLASLVKPREAREPKLYYCYGSNLHKQQMLSRCPRAKPLRKLVLKDWRLVFRGVADIEPCVGSSVQGAIWEITPDCEARLDRYEGWPHLYRKEHFMVRVRKNGHRRVEPVMFYTMNRRSYSLPYPGYAQVIHEGYTQWQLDLQALIDALQESLRLSKEGV